MGISHKSHGKKTDKETQSPVLKIFRDMVQKEKHDPEKTNLLNGKHVEKKRKHFLGYRSKTDQKSVESSSSDARNPYKQQDQELRSAEYHRSQSQSLPFQGSKSWVFWGEKSSKKGRNDDTCSCVSCALKKLIGNDYACVGCLALLFSISVIIACVLVYKCIPTVINTKPQHDSERLKRKIDSINGWGGFMPKTFEYNKNKWRDSSFQDLAVVDADSELSKIIDDSKLNEIQSSDRLRDFYKKLLKADSHIRKLKKKSEFTTFDTNLDFDFKTLPEREKRSINLLKKPLKMFHFRKHKSNKTRIDKNKLKNTNLTKTEKTRQKRFGNNSDDTIVIEKEQFLIQYKPRIVPKCSHNIAKDVTSHEHLMKHPFYKNTQRLDELLDHFNKNLPDLINDPFGLSLRFGDEKSHCKHPKINAGKIKNKMSIHEQNKKVENPIVIANEKARIDNYKTDYEMFRKMRNGNPNMEGAKTNGYADFDGDLVKRDDMTTNNYDLLLTVSTVLNEQESRTTPYQDGVERIPSLRRLLQTHEEDNENINYEDLKEVLTDDNQAHDDSDKQNRKKRNDECNPQNPNPPKYHPPNINNPNWKGPMPLYPDEINSMIKQGPVVNRVENLLQRDQTEELSDLDYIEDYLDSKYQGLVKLAQAYSDYGVLSGKKDAVTEKGASKVTDYKLNKLDEKDDFGRLSEGIRFEIHPTSTARDDNPLPIYNFLQKHIKVTKNSSPKPGYVYSTIGIPRMNVRSKKHHKSKKKKLDKDKRSLQTLEGSKLHKVSLEYDNSLAPIDLKNDKADIDNRNIKETRNNRNDLTKKGINRNILTETLNNNLNDRIMIENDSDNTKMVFKKRSLKSFEVTNSIKQFDDKIANVDTEISEENIFSVKEIDKKHSKENNNSKSKVNEDISMEDFNATVRPDMDLSDFFMMMANIFSALDAKDVATEPYNITNASTNLTSTTSDDNTTDIVYPMYDSDMIDNIGHRSRVLMSLNITGGEIEKETTYDADAKKLTMNITNPSLSINENLIKNKTARIVKRHADDNTIFWNDIYDDEYGVKMDAFENIKDKNSVTNDFIKRSNDWIQEKVKRLSDNFHRSPINDDEKIIKRAGRSVWYSDNNENARYYSDRNSKMTRKSRSFDQESEKKKTDFSALTVHMKDVCRRAATVVRESGETDDKDEKTNSATTGLMQQLVNLMTDLIDFQVQQKTCMKLPPDLYSFLEWLTDLTPTDPGASINDDNPAKLMYTVDLPEENRKDNSENPSDMPSDLPSEREDQDPRSDCLGTLQAIQDLLQSFESMPDDDKSKMTGVKEYLLSQITYLKKRIADEDYNAVPVQDNTYKYKRDLARRRHRFLRNYSKRHTKTTASYYDGVTFSEPFETLTRKKVKEKRNLRDIYYKAVEDAKKMTTVKNHH